MSGTPPQVQIESGLIATISADDRHSYIAENQLFEQYIYLLKEGIRKHNLEEDEVFDAYSDTILSVIKQIKAGKFEGRSSLKTFVYQIFMNKCVDFLRKKSTKKASVYQGVDIQQFTYSLATDTKNILQELVDQCDTRKLEEKLRQIGEKCHSVLLMWGEGVSDEKIAEKMLYNSAGVVKTTRIRCLKKLREVYLK